MSNFKKKLIIFIPEFLNRAMNGPIMRYQSLVGIFVYLQLIDTCLIHQSLGLLHLLLGASCEFRYAKRVLFNILHGDENILTGYTQKSIFLNIEHVELGFQYSHEPIYEEEIPHSVHDWEILGIFDKCGEHGDQERHTEMDTTH